MLLGEHEILDVYISDVIKPWKLNSHATQKVLKTKLKMTIWRLLNALISRDNAINKLLTLWILFALGLVSCVARIPHHVTAEKL